MKRHRPLGDEEPEPDFEPNRNRAEETSRKDFVRSNRLVPGAYYWLIKAGYSINEKHFTIGQYYAPDTVFNVVGTSHPIPWHRIRKVIARIKEP